MSYSLKAKEQVGEYLARSNFLCPEQLTFNPQCFQEAAESCPEN